MTDKNLAKVMGKLGKKKTSKDDEDFDDEDEDDEDFDDEDNEEEPETRPKKEVKPKEDVVAKEITLLHDNGIFRRELLLALKELSGHLGYIAGYLKENQE